MSTFPSTSCATPCRARRSVVHVVIVSIYATITCSAGGTVFAGTCELQASERIGYLDVFMVQTSVDVLNEVQPRSSRSSRRKHPEGLPPAALPSSGMPAAAVPPAGMPAAAFPPSGMPAAAFPPSGMPAAAFARTTCVDTANGATNRLGNGCDVYTHDAESPYAGICFDPYYDDEDFTSGTMCCVCPQECPAPETSERPDDCEDWIEFTIHDTAGVRNPHSNLGGLGPDGDRPKEIRYYGVGRLPNGVFYDLAFVNTTVYVPKNTNWNTILGNEAIVNTLVGSTTTIKAEFVRNHTFCPLVPVMPKITFCDIDHAHDGENEVLMLDGVSALYTVDGDIDYALELYEPGGAFDENPVPLAYTTESIPTLVPGRTARKYVSSIGGKFGIKATSLMFGHGCDNPTGSNELTNITCPDENAVPVDQAKRCFMAEFSNTSEFEVGYRVLTYHPPDHVQEWGRNFVMSGTSSFFAHEGTGTCLPTAKELLPILSPAAPTPAPTPAPTAASTPAPTVPGIPGGAEELQAGGSTGGAPVSAIGDPHLVNVHGQHFDVMKPGVHVLLRVPIKASRSNALILVEADAQRIGGFCADTYFMSVNLTGTWVETKVNALGLVGGHGLFFSAGTELAHTGTPWMSFGKMWLKVRHGRTNSGTAYLNFFARNLRHTGHLVGGLLGEDDHVDVATLNPGCKKTLSI